MNLKLYYRSFQKPDLFWVIISLLNILIIASLVYLLFFHPSSPGSPAYNLTAKALEHLKKNEDYVLYIYEHAGENSLSFRGHFAEGCLTGTILEHNLQIYYEPDDLFVRYDDESDWEKTDQVELAKLKAFLTSPHEIIELIGDQLDNVLMGPEKGHDDDIYKTVYWIIDSPEMWETLFPIVDPTIIEEGTLSMEISAKEYTICQFRIHLVIATPTEKKQIIQRTLNLSFDKQKV